MVLLEPLDTFFYQQGHAIAEMVEVVLFLPLSFSKEV